LDAVVDVSPNYKAVVTRCLADVDRRYQSAAELVDDIRRLLDTDFAPSPNVAQENVALKLSETLR
jgi:hypothetical protein